MDQKGLDNSKITYGLERLRQSEIKHEPEKVRRNIQ